MPRALLPRSCRAQACGTRWRRASTPTEIPNANGNIDSVLTRASVGGPIGRRSNLPDRVRSRGRRMSRSTTALRRHGLSRPRRDRSPIAWCRLSESNGRPSAYKAGALPTELSRLGMRVWSRVRPAQYRCVSAADSGLEARPFKRFTESRFGPGGDGGDISESSSASGSRSAPPFFACRRRALGLTFGPRRGYRDPNLVLSRLRWGMNGTAKSRGFARARPIAGAARIGWCDSAMALKLPGHLAVAASGVALAFAREGTDENNARWTVPPCALAQQRIP